jgi:hypothetical protein
MLQLEGVAQDDNDTTSDSGEGRMEAQKRRLRPVRSVVSSDGYSPVATDGDIVALSKPRMKPAAPLPTIRAPKTCAEPARHDIHVQLQSRRIVIGNAPVCPASSAHVNPETQAKHVGWGSKDSDGDGDGESSRLPLGYVSRKSVALLRKSNSFEPDFQTRMERFQQRSRQKKEELRQRAAIAEQARVHTPKINKVGQHPWSCSSWETNLCPCWQSARSSCDDKSPTCLPGRTRRRISSLACAPRRRRRKSRPARQSLQSARGPKTYSTAEVTRSLAARSRTDCNCSG